MRKELLGKTLVIGVIFLFVGVSVIPSTVGIIEKKTTIRFLNYHGYIQDLIDNASDGDTIYIPSGIYYENIIIDKSISLVGENRDTTIIDGNKNGDVINVSANHVTISNFTIQYAESWGAGINVWSNNNNFDNNIITHNTYGIKLMPYSSKNRITNNIFRSSSYSAIATYLSSYNIIYNNNISTSKGRGIYSMAGHNNQIIKNYLKDVGGSCVISIWNSHSNTIYLNTIIDNYNSIAIDLTTWLHVDAINGLSYNNKIILNNIENNRFGLWLDFSLFTTIKKNNFINNGSPQARFQGSYFTKWVSNYWDDWDLVGPYEIKGIIFIFLLGGKDWYNYDRSPASEPYDIPGSYYYKGCGIV